MLPALAAAGIEVATVADARTTLSPAARSAQAAGIEVTDVGYRGGGPAIQGVLTGEAGMLFMPASAVMGFMASGDLRALADRLAGLDGTLSLSSPPGGPTLLTAVLPEPEEG